MPGVLPRQARVKQTEVRSADTPWGWLLKHAFASGAHRQTCLSLKEEVAPEGSLSLGGPRSHSLCELEGSMEARPLWTEHLGNACGY